MTSTTCSDCRDNTSLTTEQCMACPQFAQLLMQHRIVAPDDDEPSAPSFPVMQMLALCIGGSGFIAALSGMPIVAGGTLFFAFGLCLADYLGSN